MIVRELIEELKRLDPMAHVVINGRIVAAVEEVRGRVGDGTRHWPDDFRHHDAGRDKGVVFLIHREMSDGYQGLSRIHT